MLVGMVGLQVTMDIRPLDWPSPHLSASHATVFALMGPEGVRTVCCTLMRPQAVWSVC